ncbi:MAG: YdiU family protein [Candidatus Latescibacteria bacterium]|nr:YdiU family protein [Candidatus Latescibacterota bacterium]
MSVGTVAELNFDNRFTAELPGDSETANRPRQVMGACYSAVEPVRTRAPQLVACSREMVEELELAPQVCQEDEFAAVFSGNSVLPSMQPYAMCYGGHQFGNWAGQLGDGRAINLGEVVTGGGQRWALQLKGAGPTPYSRTADGLAVLRSSVREFLCSEAMHHLGVPTTRALSLALTGDQVVRDMFYDGNPKAEPGAVVCRMAPSFIRFGNFEIFASRGEMDVLQQLVDFTIRTEFPHLGPPSTETYLAWFAEVSSRTAAMVVEWMRVGFVHGVMNTDNMSILGLTIDYGPYGWLEDYDPGWTPNTTDAQGRRYRFGQQAQVAQWNLLQLARALAPLIKETEPLQEALNKYAEVYNEGFQAMMAAKLGLRQFAGEADQELIDELQAILPLVETDMTVFFRQLAAVGADALATGPELELWQGVASAYYRPEQVDEAYRARLGAWLRRYGDRLQKDGRPAQERRRSMDAVNPKYVLRNYLAQLAIDKAEDGDFSLVGDLLEVLRRPYDEQPDKEEFAAKRPDWARERAGCSMLSCSS